LSKLDEALDNANFAVKSDRKSSLDHDLVITKNGIPVSDMGKGAQCFIKTDFALEKKDGKNPIDVVLIEEPENHLSHLNMKKLIDRIENATQNQIVIATHSNIVCSRLDLHNVSMIGTQSEEPTTLKNLDQKTANYFIKAPNTKILEMILSERVLLVEGDLGQVFLDILI